MPGIDKSTPATKYISSSKLFSGIDIEYLPSLEAISPPILEEVKFTLYLNVVSMFVRPYSIVPRTLISRVPDVFNLYCSTISNESLEATGNTSRTLS